METKICTQCKIKKSVKFFRINKQRKNKLHSWCIECQRNRIKNYYKKYPWKRTLLEIKQRCLNKNNPFYKWYGGRGIKCLITKEELKILWFRDKAWLLEKASIDRKNNDGNYTFKNCRFIELSKNTTERNIRNDSKIVFQFNLNNKFIKKWKSLNEIKRQLKFYISNISQVCLGKRKTAHNFIWKFTNKEE